MSEKLPASEESSVEEQGSAPRNGSLERLLPGGVGTKRRALVSRCTATALSLACVAAGALWLHSSVRRSGQATPSLDQLSAQHAALSKLISMDEQSDRQVKLANCVLNVDEAAFYLVQLGNFLKFSTLDCKDKTTLEQRTTCAASVGTVIASFGWVGSYVGAAVPSCGVEDNVGAHCAAGLSTLVALLGELTFVSSSVVYACNVTYPELPDEQLLPRRRSVQFHFLPHKRWKVPEPDERRAARISQCVVDVNLGLAYLGFLGTQSYRLSKECPAGDTKACGLDVFNLISSLGWAAQFLSQAAVDCPVISDLKAGCAAVVGDFVATIAALGPYVDTVTSACPKTK